MSEVNIEFPEKLKCVFGDSRYIVLHGGRAGTKSWGVARALLIMGLERPIRVLCAREFQKSIEDSVYRLLKDQIANMGMAAHYNCMQSKIVGANRTEFLFAGLRHNINNLKSYEGVDYVWVEEAATVSDNSWDVLIPTIRKEGSQFIITFNPDLEEDPTYQRFVVNPPSNAVVQRITYKDNPWLTDEIKQEIEDCRLRDPVKFKHIWLGECKQAVDGAIFADELSLADEEQRITRVPIKAGVPVHTFWDLGQSDNTAIWFCQIVGMEFRLIDYYQASGKKMPHYIEKLVELGYNYGRHYLPHDADYDLIAAQSTIKQQMQEALRDNPKLGDSVEIVPRIQQKHLAIDMARNIFGRCVFDKAKTNDGLQCLRRYRYAVDAETGKVSKKPMHDMWSHGADAFMQLAQHAAPPKKKTSPARANVKWIK